MQAVEESNRHINEVENLLPEIQNNETRAFLESEMAQAKATQAVALALLALANGLAESGFTVRLR